MWGVHKAYRLGFAVQAVRPDKIPAFSLRRIHRRTDRLARRIRKNAGRRGCNARAKKWFYLMRFAHKFFPFPGPDYDYWEAHGWHGKARPWKSVQIHVEENQNAEN